MVSLRALLPLGLLIPLLGGCPAEAPPPPEPMSSVDLLIRASLDLRGARPTLEEFTQLETDPESLDDLVDGFLLDPRFGSRVRALFAPTFGTRIDLYPVRAMNYGLEEEDDPLFQQSVGDEALRIVSHIAENDLPFTELVAGDWTMANEVLGALWPVDYPTGETGWRQVRYTDDRPRAGVLASNSMWWRYVSNGANYNRGRANAVSRIFLCHDYLEREVSFPRDLDLTDPELVADALANNSGCANCHVSLDPLASYFYGFTYANSEETLEVTNYHPERERLWETLTGVAPGFYGNPGYSLTDLGGQIASDNRFVECAVQRVYEGLLSRPVDLGDTAALTAHREIFLDAGLTLRPLFRAVVNDDRYRSATDEAGGVPRKLVPPDLLASQLEDLTGFRFTSMGYDLMETDLFGLRTLAGGADGYSLSAAASIPSPSALLAQERIAQGAAFAAAASENLPGAQRRLFPFGFPSDPEAEAADFTAQLQHLHFALFGARVEADGEEVSGGLALWEQLHEVSGDPVSAWAGLLSALFRDPDFVTY